MRWVMTRVLPLPAPARTRSGPSVVVTARRWAGFREERSKESGGVYPFRPTALLSFRSTRWPPLPCALPGRPPNAPRPRCSTSRRWRLASAWPRSASANSSSSSPRWGGPSPPTRATPAATPAPAASGAPTACSARSARAATSAPTACGCEGCSNCSHCIESKSCQSSAYLLQCDACTHSAYLVMCRNLSDCNYCFGCVGLSNKDFHILNVAFPRKEYFEVTSRLRKDLGLPAAARAADGVRRAYAARRGARSPGVSPPSPGPATALRWRLTQEGGGGKTPLPGEGASCGTPGRFSRDAEWPSCCSACSASPATPGRSPARTPPTSRRLRPPSAPPPSGPGRRAAARACAAARGRRRAEPGHPRVRHRQGGARPRRTRGAGPAGGAAPERRPEAKVEIVGHTDAVGTAERNQT